MKVREPVARPLDVVAVELLLSASQAFLVGVMLYLAAGIWDDRGVGTGPVAGILGLLGLAVGAAWAYWLLGGVGWPMAAVNVPVAMFLGFALVLGWTGDSLFQVGGVPLLISLAAAIFGIVGGVFIDSPRRWRWDQRQRLRPGTEVPRVSAGTRAVVAAVPRTIPGRSRPVETETSDLAARIESSTPVEAEPSSDAPIPYVTHPDQTADKAGSPAAAESDDAASEASSAAADVEDEEEGQTADAEPVGSAYDGPSMPTQRLEDGARSSSTPLEEDPDDEAGTLELPTSIEPKAQRSPWAWAAPPEWNRDEDDQAHGGRR